MKRVSFSDAERSIDWIWDWYEFHSKLVASAKVKILEDLASNQIASNPTFGGMSPDEIEEFFQELDYLTELDLLTAVEAALRVDFYERVQDKKKDPLSRNFQGLVRRLGNKVYLAEHILEAWKKSVPQGAAISDFKGALNLRDWLAHGRYWKPKLGRDYSPNDIFDICSNLLQTVGLK
jgi:hypothetical protein